MSITTVISALVAVGGLGFINYYVADRLGLVNFKSEHQSLQLPFMATWSAFDFGIYLLVNSFISLKFKEPIRSALSLILTIIIIFIIFTKLSTPIFKWIDNSINKQRTKQGNATTVYGDAWSELVDNGHQQIIYLFTLDGKPITAGWLDYTQRDTEARFSMNLKTLPNYDFQETLSQFLTERSNSEFETQNQIQQHIDLDRKIIVVSVIPGLGDEL